MTGVQTCALPISDSEKIKGSQGKNSKVDESHSGKVCGPGTALDGNFCVPIKGIAENNSPPDKNGEGFIKGSMIGAIIGIILIIRSIIRKRKRGKSQKIVHENMDVRKRRNSRELDKSVKFGDNPREEQGTDLTFLKDVIAKLEKQNQGLQSKNDVLVNEYNTLKIDSDKQAKETRSQ